MIKKISYWASIVLVLSSCSKAPEFRPVNSVQKSQSPGGYSIPPKVDILMVLDDTGSMAQSYSTISDQVKNTFLPKLDEGSAWDYHFAAIPLTSFRPIREVVGSVYDPARGSSWLPPFPGAEKSDVLALAPGLFRTPKTYTGIISMSDISSSLGSYEPGFENILRSMNDGFTNTGFFTDDALKVVVLLGNGNDTSNVNYCNRAVDGTTVLCETEHPVCVPTESDPIYGGAANCGSNYSSFEYYRNQFQTLHPNIRFYAAVADQDSTSCLGGSARAGTRYKQMAIALNGKSYNICKQSISLILKDLALQLQAQKSQFKSRYLIAEREPDPSTIKITRYVGGQNGIPTEVLPDPVNGWSYEGYQDHIYALYTTTPGGREVGLNRISGFAIRLNGTSELSGDDVASFEYKPADSKSSSGQ